MNEYLMKVKNMCDQLSCDGHKIPENEQVLYIVSGLEDDYQVVVAFITSTKPTPSLQNVYSMMLAHEGIIMQKREVKSDYIVNYIANINSKNQERCNNTRNQSNINYQRGTQSNRGRGRGRAARWNPNNKPKCQICDKIGHIANICYFRFDNNKSNQESTFDIAKADDIQDEAWYPDSGSTHHVTSNINNLNLRNKEYKSKQNLIVGNGNSIYITHIGHTILQGTKKTYVNNLSRVLNIKKNMISVSQYARDNDVYFEFYPNHCLIKDILTKEILL